METIVLHSEQDTADLAARLAPLLKLGDVLYLYGDLGSGKTFFAKQLGRCLGVIDELDSPSFVLMKEYHNGRFPLFHLDLYRLKTPEEVLDLGIFDMLESGITLIEWPALAEELLPKPRIRLDFHFDGTRRWVQIETNHDNPPPKPI